MPAADKLSPDKPSPDKPSPDRPPAHRGAARSRRDRRGRGLRWPLLPTSVPAARTRSQRFDELVLDAVDDMGDRWRDQLAAIEFAVEEVPPADPSPWEAGQVPLGRYFPADRDLPARVVLYRRPVQGRAHDDEELSELVTQVVVEHVSHALGVDPDQLHPRFRHD